MRRFHKENGALVTVGLTRVPDPLEFGIVIADEDGRIQRFLEKPTWGQVFSDTVNTGVYIMEPEVLAEVSREGVGRLVARRVPQAAGARRADLRLHLRQVLGGRRHARELHEGPGGRAEQEGRGRHRRVRGLARHVDRRGRRRGPGRGAEGAARHRRLREDRGGRDHPRVQRDRRQRGGQGGRVHPPRGGAQQRVRRPGHHAARLRGRQEHRRDAAGADRGGRGRSATSAWSSPRRTSPPG